MQTASLRDKPAHAGPANQNFSQRSDISLAPAPPTAETTVHFEHFRHTLLNHPRGSAAAALGAVAPPLSRLARFVKRAEDVLLSCLLLLLTGPLMVLVSLAIKIESRGPVLFRQPRHGFNGAEFKVFKFRTMYAGTEDKLATRQTLREDPRVTRIGSFLRRHSIDELPQLFNVLAGSMSLVGPRPHAPATTAGGLSLHEAVPDYASRHRVKPGITGWAQVCGFRGNLDTVEKAVRRVDHDLYYIENWSLLLDLRIIAMTVGLVLHDHEAF